MTYFFYASICSTTDFSPLGNSDHFVSISIDLPSYSQRHAPFHRIAYDYSRTDWDGSRDYLRCSMGMDGYIPHRKYQVIAHLSPWFSADCAVAIVHRNHLSRLYQKDKSSESHVKFRQTSNRCKRVFGTTKLA